MENLWSDSMKPYFPGSPILDRLDLFGEVNKIVVNINNQIEKETMKEIYEKFMKTSTKPILYASSSGYGRTIIDVNIIVPNKVVEVTFADGTKEKSVCHEPDVFSLEQAISICIAKKIMGGSSKYNNSVKAGIKVYEDKLKDEAADKLEMERIERKRVKRLVYMERRKEKIAEVTAEKLQKKREDMIEIQKEAYIRAMEIVNGGSK